MKLNLQLAKFILHTGKCQSVWSDSVIGVATDNISHVLQSSILQRSAKASLLKGIQLGVRKRSVTVPVANGKYPAKSPFTLFRQLFRHIK